MTTQFDRGNGRRRLAVGATNSSPRRRPQRSRLPPGLVGFLLLLLLLLPLPRASDAASSRRPPPSSSERNLQDGAAACAGCEGATFQCSGRTIGSEHCAPCATGQSWWPCNLVGECYCEDLTPKPEVGASSLGCDIPLCEPGESGNKPVPFTSCEEYVTCSSGTPGTVQRCAPGQAYSPRISACNVVMLVECPEDPTCPPTNNPTPASDAPTATMPPPSGSPTVTSSPSSGSGGGGGGDAPDGAGLAAAPVESARPPRPDPAVLEGTYVVEAHMAANKMALARELLAGPGGSGGRGRGAGGAGRGANNDFSYSGFRSSLRSMILTGAANRTFYIGHPGLENGSAYGLVNVAAFLAMSAEDSISHGSCDEVNHDVIGGELPVSNACGQGGRNYGEMTCPAGEEMYQCDVDPTMRAAANDVDGARDDGSPPPDPFYCGPTTDYEGYTGQYDYVSETETPHPPVENGHGKKDVEGCCWWGRGSVQVRGLCAYGKLNYFLGKRAHDEGRPSMFPDVDFCRDPQAVCSHPDHPDLKWIAGMFRWITEVQPYDAGGFSYMQRLVDFVEGGLRDWSFVHGLSGIVTQGCHEPPCAVGVEFEDGASRKATFIKTLKLLGLSPGPSEGTVTAAVAGGRRLGYLPSHG